MNGSVSKIHTETGKELGRYWIAPPSIRNNASPSRTTVDLEGSCWVGNRFIGTVVKIGLELSGGWVDRNSDGVCQTSRDADDDGLISAAEMLNWGVDECVLYEVILVEGHQATYRPGEYAGPYTTGPIPRACAVDCDGNIWVGTYGTMKAYHLDGKTAEIIAADTRTFTSIHPYGFVIDRNGYVWIAELSGDVYRMNPSDPTDLVSVDLNHCYGLSIDNSGNIIISGYGKISKIEPTAPTLLWTVNTFLPGTGHMLRGICATGNNDIWTAWTTGYAIEHYDSNGVFIDTIRVGTAPTGVAVDSLGKVWSCNYGDEYIKRIDPATDAVDFSIRLPGTIGHYSYSDMTGIVSRSIMTKTGTWNAVYDYGIPSIPWGTASWNANVPTGTTIEVKFRTSEDRTA